MVLWYSIHIQQQQIVPINIYLTGSTDLIRSFLEDLLSMIICNTEAHNKKMQKRHRNIFQNFFLKDSRMLSWLENLLGAKPG